MQSTKPRWHADRGARALKTINAIECSIVGLCDEDLLDLQDIFSGATGSPIEALTADEMRRRNLTA
jgi:hypothetical protein